MSDIEDRISSLEYNLQQLEQVLSRKIELAEDRLERRITDAESDIYDLKRGR